MEIQEANLYYNENGEFETVDIKIDGNWYLFDPRDGTLAHLPEYETSDDFDGRLESCEINVALEKLLELNNGKWPEIF